ncbi:DNA polymerase delta catalytic subunit [Theileria orientalis strain Shintoku]|uniref:DNA polymerase n=1 Tax=Theileria orientalis strain Shintoku TaxID=869250 RepID=J4D675_THEOR|nr:DNA polymerase delta catalytic subunit [Theileria orientalis strain Shintoku]BAM39390.1 DNA polymerase delta catalytic subunit [Theileria orientalis strain Shintoku]|eukprot:XP_009689691.1 DNA polymerase delta catalytic subunit [Theileria orientalis strain Shintoku]
MIEIEPENTSFGQYSNFYGTKNDYGTLFRSLKRPDVDYIFFLTDADYTFKNVKYDANGGSERSDQGTEVPIIRLYGVTKQEQSVLVSLQNFNPYFYIEKPAALLDRHFDDLKELFTRHLSEQNQFKRSLRYVLDIQKVRLTSLMLYDENSEKDFLKITVSVPRMVSNLRTFIESGIYLKVYDQDRNEVRVAFSRQTYEANLPYTLRFLLDCNIVSGSWLKIPKGQYTLVEQPSCYKVHPSKNGWDRSSTCSIEVVAEYDAVISLPLEGEYEEIGPIKILSFDIECIKLTGTGFPNANYDPVIQISSVIYTHGKDINETRNFVFTLKDCDQLSNAAVLSFETEDQLLLAWSDFLVQVDPDFLTGYNIIVFDLPYLLTRSTVLNIERFKKITRIRSTSSNFKDAIVSNNMMGTYENKDINIEGRIMFDVYDLVRRDHKLKSYTLNYVSFEFLGQQKEDVHYSTISKLQQGTSSDRRRIASYCLKDAILPLLLINKLLLVFNYVEMARVTSTPIKFLITRGQQIRVTMQIYRQCRKMKYVIPVISSAGRHGSNENNYEGATVLDPQKGYHTNPIAVLDFQSLYPSIMIAYNLCYSTLVPQNKILNHPEEDVTRIPGYIDLCFVKATKRKGILPIIVENLIEARRKAKKMMASCQDPMLKKVYDGRQLALKVTTNSVYGYTGAASGGFLPCVDVATAITSFGRNIILNTKNIIEDHFTVKNGYKNDAKVVYGDTDSVMINFGTEDIQEAIDLGNEAASKITSVSVKPITLLFEKVYRPLLLLNKKRYAGLYYNNSKTYEKIDCKGIETVRRDFCMLVQQMMERVLYLLLVELNLPAAIEFVKNKVSELLRNEIDISLLVVTKSLGKLEYEQRLPHVELAKKLRKRDPGKAPGVGDRISYIIVKGTKGEAQYDRAEEPLYVTENNLPIDTNHYLESIKTTLLRIFDVVMPNPQSLFSGEHTRVINISSNTGGLMNKFLKKVNRCLSCNTVIQTSTFCDNCNQSKKQQVLLDKLKICRMKEETYFKLWTHCQRCQGNLHSAVVCDNRDCPIFYRRVKTSKDLSNLVNTLNTLQIGYED